MNRSRDNQQRRQEGAWRLAKLIQTQAGQPNASLHPEKLNARQGDWRSDPEGGQRGTVLNCSWNPPPPTSRPAPSVSTNMQPINVIAELFMVPSKVQLDPNRQGWKQRKKALSWVWLCDCVGWGFFFPPLLSDVSINLWYPCVWWSWPLPVSTQVFLPGGQGVGRKRRGNPEGKAKGLRISNCDLTEKTFSRFPTPTAPLS